MTMATTTLIDTDRMGNTHTNSCAVVVATGYGAKTRLFLDPVERHAFVVTEMPLPPIEGTGPNGCRYVQHQLPSRSRADEGDDVAASALVQGF